MHISGFYISVSKFSASYFSFAGFSRKFWIIFWIWKFLLENVCILQMDRMDTENWEHEEKNL